MPRCHAVSVDLSVIVLLTLAVLAMLLVVIVAIAAIVLAPAVRRALSERSAQHATEEDADDHG